MIIGNGLLAKTFTSYENNKDIVIFASGVSNSNCIDSNEYKRETDLLNYIIDKNQDKTIVYFSSCDVANDMMNNKAYYKHKLTMENILQKNAESYHIFRLPQVIGQSSNTKTLINFLYSAVENKTPFSLHIGTSKNIIDIKDVYKLCSYIVEHKLHLNEIVNIITTQYIEMIDLVHLIENIIEKKAVYKKHKVISNCSYDDTVVKEISLNAGVVFDKDYLENVLHYYYKEKV